MDDTNQMCSPHYLFFMPAFFNPYTCISCWLAGHKWKIILNWRKIFRDPLLVFIELHGSPNGTILAASYNIFYENMRHKLQTAKLKNCESIDAERLEIPEFRLIL